MLPSTTTALLALLLSTLTSAATNPVSVVLKDFSSIKNQTLHIRDETAALQPSPDFAEQAIQIDTDTQALDATIRKTTADADALPQLGKPDSAKIANAVNGIQRPVFDTLDTLVEQREVFDQIVDGSAGLVEADLRKLKADTLALGKAVTPKLSSALAKLAPLLVDNLDFHFQRAVDAFAT